MKGFPPLRRNCFIVKHIMPEMGEQVYYSKPIKQITNVWIQIKTGKPYPFFFSFLTFTAKGISSPYRITHHGIASWVLCPLSGPRLRIHPAISPGASHWGGRPLFFYSSSLIVRGFAPFYQFMSHRVACSDDAWHIVLGSSACVRFEVPESSGNKPGR